MTLSSPAVTGEAHAIMRIVLVLPAPFGPRKPNASAGAHVEVDGVDRGEVVEALRQIAGVDKDLFGRGHARF